MTRYRIADDVAWVSDEALDAGTVPSAYVTHLPQGPPVTLDGPACVVWLALADGGTREEVTAAVARMWDADPEAISGDVDALVDDLVRAGLVVAD